MKPCPVCGYPEMPARLKWEICPSCGTEFGLSDAGRGHDELRQTWIADGAKWASPVVAQPRFWAPITQLRNIGYEATDQDVKSMVAADQINNRIQSEDRGNETFRIEDCRAVEVGKKRGRPASIPVKHICPCTNKTDVLSFLTEKLQAETVYTSIRGWMCWRLTT